MEPRLACDGCGRWQNLTVPRKLSVVGIPVNFPRIGTVGGLVGKLPGRRLSSAHDIRVLATRPAIPKTTAPMMKGELEFSNCDNPIVVDPIVHNRPECSLLTRYFVVLNGCLYLCVKRTCLRLIQVVKGFSTFSIDVPIRCNSSCVDIAIGPLAIQGTGIWRHTIWEVMVGIDT